ncbi:MAG: hypothetical protein IKH57_22590 [Clostridia bacterium]|nr:hypothetical protein [Clostridia bacterium]
MELKDILEIGMFISLVVFVLSIVSAISSPSKIRKSRMSREEREFAEEAYKLHMSGMDAKTSRKAEEKLLQYEALYSDIASKQSLVSEHIYQEDMSDIRENYESLTREEWQEKADKILDKFYDLYSIITDPNFKDVEKAYSSKKRCIKYWQDYFSSIPYETGIWFDAKFHMREHLGLNYDICMDSHESLEKKLSQCIDEMKPEYKRKMNLRKQIIDTVAEQESIMRSKLIATPFEGCTVKEVEYCIKELVEKYQLVSVKIGNRYFVSLSDKEKQRRDGHKIKKPINVNVDNSKKKEAFIGAIENQDSIMEIWKAWEESGLGSFYGKLDMLITKEKNSERMYGKVKSDTEALKLQIQNALMKEE